MQMSSNNPISDSTIAVIILAYNLENFLEEAILSVLSQTRKADRIILVDDGSTDKSLQIAQRYSDYIDIISSDLNCGALPALLKGIQCTDADIISFLDGDDVWHRDKLMQIERKFNSDTTLMLVTHGYTCIDATGNSAPYSRDKTYMNMQRIHRLYAHDSSLESNALVDSILQYKGCWLGSAWSFRRNCFRLATFFDFICSIELHNYSSLTHQDQPIAAFILLDPENCERKVGYIDLPLFQYRLHGSNTSGDFSSPDGARRSALRAFATVYGTQILLSRSPFFKVAAKIQKKYVAQAQSVYALYTDQPLSIYIPLLLQSFSLSRFSAFALEMIRFLTVRLFGLPAFLAAKRQQHRFVSAVGRKAHFQKSIY